MNPHDYIGYRSGHSRGPSYLQVPFQSQNQTVKCCNRYCPRCYDNFSSRTPHEIQMSGYYPGYQERSYRSRQYYSRQVHLEYSGPHTAAVYELIHSIQDEGDSHRIKKLKLSEQATQLLLLASNQNFVVCGFYGDARGSVVAASKFLQANIPAREEGAQTERLRLQAAVHTNKIALIIHAHPDLFSRSVDSKGQLMELIMYLLDICNSVVVSMPADTEIQIGKPWYQSELNEVATVEILHKDDCLTSVDVQEILVNVQNSRYLSYQPTKSGSARLFSTTATTTRLDSRRFTIDGIRSYSFDEWNTKFSSLKAKQIVTKEIELNPEGSLVDQLNIKKHFLACSWNEDTLNEIDRTFKQKIKQVKIDDVQQLTQMISTTLKNYDQVNNFECRMTIEINTVKLSILQGENGAAVGAKIQEDLLKLRETFITEGLKEDNFYLIPLNSKQGFLVVNGYPTQRASAIYSYRPETSYELELVKEYKSPTQRLVVNERNNAYLLYNNSSRKAEYGTIKNGKTFKGSKSQIYADPMCRLSSISAVTITDIDEVLILDSDGTLYSYTNQPENLVELSTFDSHGRRIRISAEQPDDRYNDIMAAAGGKLIYLVSSTAVDVYDRQTLKKINSIKKEADYLTCTPVFDEKLKQNFLLVQYKQRMALYQIGNNHISSEHAAKRAGARNPHMDYLRLAMDTFGPPSLETDPQTVTFLTEWTNREKIAQQWQIIKFPEIELSFDENYIGCRAINLKRLHFLLHTRVAVHVASIQDYNMVPLSNGEYSRELYLTNHRSEQGASQMKIMCDKIRFGHLEEILQSWKGPVKVVSIIGTQSSGKSYLLNRLFGTRFNVSAARCTDGIWMSLSETKTHDGREILIVAFDCEGLSSTERKKNEEIKLCLALTSLSDVIILNQVKHCDRNTFELINEIADQSKRLSGQQLFKGYLANFLRDVDEGGKEEAQAEVKKFGHQLVRANNLTCCFRNQVSSYLFTHFQQPNFERDLDAARGYCQSKLVEDLDRWASGDDFLLSFKVLISQLMMDDTNSLDDHKSVIVAQRSLEKVEHAFLTGKGVPELEEPCVFQIRSRASNPGSMEVESTIQITIRHSEIELADFQQPLPEFNFNDSMILMQTLYIPEPHAMSTEQNIFVQISSPELKKFIESQIGEYCVALHDTWVREASQIWTHFFDSRRRAVEKLFDRLFANQGLQIKQEKHRDLEKYLLARCKNIKLCGQSCRNCARLCFQAEGHSKDCNCLTDHLCQEYCLGSDVCTQKAILCRKAYGHHGIHACNEKHKCKAICSIKDCTQNCQLESEHASSHHNCGNNHPCSHLCSQTNCKRSCGDDRKHAHTVHTCNETRCSMKCVFCDKQCAVEDHFHDEAIHNGDPSVLNHHNCGSSDHACANTCEVSGSCMTDQKLIVKTFKNSMGEFSYDYWEPFEVRHSCSVVLPVNATAHSGPCACSKPEADHTCNQKCPDCRSFCSLPHGHSGNHEPKTHRNKENCQFVSTTENGLLTIENRRDDIRVYQAGESCVAEICSDSCARKSRAHYHLLECPGGTECPALTNPNVEHCTDEFHPVTERSSTNGCAETTGRP